VFSVEMLASAVRMTVPVLVCSLGAIYNERSGVINIGLEGMMIVGSFWGAWGALQYGPLFGILLGIVAGAAMAGLHAVATVTFRVDQIVSGVALNLLAYGLARFCSILFFQMATTSPYVPRLASIDVPVLGRVPGLEPFFADLSPIIVLAFVLVALTWWTINRTRFGLRLRAVGENPAAADTLGINVILMRYAAVLISGAFAGLAGAYLSVEHTGMYIEGMTQGKGFIALAAMIFGNWRAVGALWASLLFGFAEAASFRVVAEGVPYQFIKMIPYVLTVVVLAGFVRRAQPPASIGEPFARGGE